MKKNYFYITLLLFFFFSLGAIAQESRQAVAAKEPIEDLNIYPNPVSGDRIYITSKTAQNKEVVIFDVLGKKIMQTILTGKELNIGNLTPGVYIIKVKEGDATATRKLIVK